MPAGVRTVDSDHAQQCPGGEGRKSLEEHERLRGHIHYTATEATTLLSEALGT